MTNSEIEDMVDSKMEFLERKKYMEQQKNKGM
jgi:hypothetical protein